MPTSTTAQEATKARRHHVTPQFYLRGFADEHERILQIDNKTGMTTRKRVSRVAFRNHAYRPDTLRVDAEKELAEQETGFARLLRSFGRHWPPGSRERRAVARLLLLQICRDPDRRLDQLRAMREAIPDAWDEGESDQDVFLLSFGILLLDPDDADQRAKLAESGWLDRIEELVAVVSERAWTLLTLPSGTAEFLTSDSPVVPTLSGPLPPSESGVANVTLLSHAEAILFPLNRRQLLVAHEGSPSQDLTRRPQVREVLRLNAIVMHCAKRFAYGHPAIHPELIKNARDEAATLAQLRAAARGAQSNPALNRPDRMARRDRV